MIISAAQLKSARRYAQRVGQQIGEALDGNVMSEQQIEPLLDAWTVFIAQFGDPIHEPEIRIVRDYLAEAYRVGVSGTTSDRLRLVH